VAIDCVTKHRVFVYDRGGVNRIDELVRIGQVTWGRVRDDISEMSMTLSAASCDVQSGLLSQIEPGRHELVVFRNDVRVWEGPITRIQYARGSVVLEAKDVMYYAYRTIMHAAWNNAYPNVTFATTRAKNILVGELARKEALVPPINVVPYIVEHHLSTDAKTSRSTLPYQYTVFEQIDDMASKGGMDYTVLGRAIHLWDTSVALGYAPQMTENDILGEMYVSVYGSELGTRAVATDGQGTYGIAGGTDSYYGEWERLDTAYDEATSDGPPPTQAELISQAKRNLAGRKPTPVQVRIPDNSTLNPAGVLTVDDLVPGVYVPLLATLSARTISQMQKIQSTRFSETADGEQISLTLYPASAADVA